MIDVNKIKSYSDDKKDGYISAITTILNSLENSTEGSGGMGAGGEPDSRLKMPNLPNKNFLKSKNNKSQNNNSEHKNKEDSSSTGDPSSGASNQQLNQKKIEQIRELVKKLRNAADDVVDDSDDEIQSGKSDEAQQTADMAQKISDTAKKLENDIKQDSNAEDKVDRYKKRLQKIADFWDDSTIDEVKKELASGKDYQETKKRLRVELKKALDNKKHFYNYKKVNIDNIKNEIVRTLKKEYLQSRDSDYQHYSYKSQTYGRPVPGRFMTNKGKRIPVVALFFDESGSWSGDAEKYAMEEKITSSIVELDKKGIIKLQIYFFADTTSTDRTKVGGGNSDAPVPFIKKLLQTKQIDNAIIMTDDNPSTNDKITLPGYLWLLFYDTIATTFVQNLKGKKGTSVYMIDHDEKGK